MWITVIYLLFPLLLWELHFAASSSLRKAVSEPVLLTHTNVLQRSLLPVRMPWVSWETCSHTALAVTEELNIYWSGRCRGYRERRDSLYENLLLSVASACKAKQFKRTSTEPNPKHHNSDDIPTTCCEKPTSCRKQPTVESQSCAIRNLISQFLSNQQGYYF